MPGRGTKLLLFLPLAVLAADLNPDAPRPAPQPEAVREFLTLTCSSRIVASSCARCPDFTTYPRGTSAQTWDVAAVHYGHFTDPSADQALVAMKGCEPHANDWGGTMLFTRSHGQWKFDRYTGGLITDDCISFRRDGGLDLLVCASSGGWQGGWTRTIYPVDPLRFEDPMEPPLLVLTDTTGACGNVWPGVRYQKAAFRSIAADPAKGEIRAQVEFGIRTMTKADLVASCVRGPGVFEPATKTYVVRFVFDGTEFHIAPESVAAKRTVEALGGQPSPISGAVDSPHQLDGRLGH